MSRTRKKSNKTPTGLEHMRRSKIRASIRSLYDAACRYEIKSGRPIDMDLVKGVFGPRLAEQQILASDTACLAAYLHHMGEYDEFSLGMFGDTRFCGAVSHQAMTPLTNEFAHYDKIKLFKKMEDAIYNPREAPIVLFLLLTHNRCNKTGERRLVQLSFSVLVIGVLKHLIDGMDFATLTFSYQYLDMKHEGIRRSLKEWNRIAKLMGEQYLCKKTNKMVPTSRFWEAVKWLKDQNVIQSKPIAVKTSSGKYKAIPSLKSISRDFLVALGFQEARLEELKKRSEESTIERLLKRIESLTTPHFKPAERLRAAARHVQSLKEKGVKVARTIHDILKIPIIMEFEPNEVFTANSS